MGANVPVRLPATRVTGACSCCWPSAGGPLPSGLPRLSQQQINRIQAPAGRGLVRPDRKRADSDDLTIVIALGAFGERVIDRGLLGRRLQSQPGTAGRADRDSVPAARGIREAARDVV